MGAMTTLQVADIERDVPGFLRRVEAGEPLLIVRDGEPIAEVRPVNGRDESTPRPYGLAKDDGIWIADDFDAPLPEDILRDFEGR